MYSFINTNIIHYLSYQYIIIEYQNFILLHATFALCCFLLIFFMNLSKIREKKSLWFFFFSSNLTVCICCVFYYFVLFITHLCPIFALCYFLFIFIKILNKIRGKKFFLGFSWVILEFSSIGIQSRYYLWCSLLSPPPPSIFSPSSSLGRSFRPLEVIAWPAKSPTHRCWLPWITSDRRLPNASSPTPQRSSQNLDVASSSPCYPPSSLLPSPARTCSTVVILPVPPSPLWVVVLLALSAAATTPDPARPSSRLGLLADYKASSRISLLPDRSSLGHNRSFPIAKSSTPSPSGASSQIWKNLSWRR